MHLRVLRNEKCKHGNLKNEHRLNAKGFSFDTISENRFVSDIFLDDLGSNIMPIGKVKGN